MKYLRLLRLQDQYVEVCAVLGAAKFINLHDVSVLWWALAAVFLSIPAYIINELTDSKDADRYSWNKKVHIQPQDHLDKRIVVVLFSLISFLGLLLARSLGLFWWGLAIWIIGLLYSLEPIRLKRFFGLDLAAQLLPFLILPYLATVWGRGNPDLTLVLLIVVVTAILTTMVPYQLADLPADQKAGLRGTLVFLGMKKSMYIGSGIGVFAIFSFFLFDLYRWVPWTIPCMLFAPLSLWLYSRWLRMKSVSLQLADIRHWVGIVKPLSQLTLVYLFVVWRFF